MDLRQLEYFCMAGRLGNVTRAAERLRVSQPNVTVAIKKLETELGILLFDRSNKQLILTPEGAMFLDRVEKALSFITDAVTELNDYRDLHRGTIKIGIPPMMGAHLFPKIFSTFFRQYPQLDINLFEEGSMSIREKLELGELDFGIVIISGAASTLQVLPMSKSRLMTIVSTKSPLAEKKVLTAKDVAESDVILLKEGSFLREFLLEQMKQAGIDPHIVLESSQMATIKGLVAQGVGIAFLLDMVLSKTYDKGIKAVPLAKPLYVDVGLAWKKGRYVSKAASSFIEFCRHTFGDIGKKTYSPKYGRRISRSANEGTKETV